MGHFSKLHYKTTIPPLGACIRCWLGGELTFWEGVRNTKQCPGNSHEFQAFAGDKNEIINLRYY